MKILSAFKHGLIRVSRTKRMVFFAWFVNVVIVLPLALPALTELNSYLRSTVLDEQILQHMDAAWMDGFRADHASSEVFRHMDSSIFGYAPFMSQLEMRMNGMFIKTLGDFLYDLLFRWEINTSATSLLFLLGLLYVCASSFLAGGFIGIYSKEYPFSFTEFLSEGARYFGKFFRLTLVALVIFVLFFMLIVDPINTGIARWTSTEASETVPYAYYMIRNVIVLFLLSVLYMIVDYARIRMVVDDRTSAIAAAAAGTKFALSEFRSAYSLYLLLCLVGVLLIALYAVIEHAIPQNSYWPLLVLFILQQGYLFARLWLKAGFYACQTKLYQAASFEEHLRKAATPQAT